MLQLPSVDGGFRVVAADPPWRFGDNATRGAAENHYPTMSVEEIAAMPVQRIVHADSALALWFPDTHLMEALTVAKFWGFTYRHLIPWTKARLDVVVSDSGAAVVNWKYQIGLGHRMRKAHEMALLCDRGRPTVNDRGVASAIIQPRGEHSAKPEELQNRLERMYAGPYIELFARRQRPGWVCWGNQAGGS